MNEQQQSLDTLKDIRSMMERSSRFISLSGWSGVAAGCCALVGAYMANKVIGFRRLSSNEVNDIKRIATEEYTVHPFSITNYMGSYLVQVALLTLVAAFITAFIFTYLRSKKTGVPLWGGASRRVAVSVGVPMAIGGLYLLKLMQAGAFGLIAPGCLLFYGLALVNASKYTLGEIKYLGYALLLTGAINLFYVGYGLYFWAFGFGVLHIVYGLIMWWKHERISDV